MKRIKKYFLSDCFITILIFMVFILIIFSILIFFFKDKDSTDFKNLPIEGLVSLILGFVSLSLLFIAVAVGRRMIEDREFLKERVLEELKKDLEKLKKDEAFLKEVANSVARTSTRGRGISFSPDKNIRKK